MSKKQPPSSRGVSWQASGVAIYYDMTTWIASQRFAKTMMADGMDCFTLTRKDSEEDGQW